MVLRNLAAVHRPDEHMDAVLVAGGRHAREGARIGFGRLWDREAIFERRFATLVAGPALGVRAKLMADVPFRIAEATHPQAFHVQRGARIDDQFAVVGLGDRAVLVAEQDGRRFFH